MGNAIPYRPNLVARLYLWATERLYNELAWAYDLVSWLVSLGHWAEWRRTALEYVTGRRVLEIGFGTGELLIEARRRFGCAPCGLEIYGLERSAAMHRVTASKLARRGITLPRVRALAQAMPFASGCFDTILSTFPARYILDPATTREVARLLRSPGSAEDTGGRFVIVGLCCEFKNSLLRSAMRVIFGETGSLAMGHVLTLYERLAISAGLRVRINSREGKWVKIPVLILEKDVGTG